MIAHEQAQGSAHATAARRQFLQAAASLGVGAGVVLTGRTLPAARAAASPRPAGCREGVQEILNLSLAIEHVATTFYYTGLTSRAILRDPHVAGASANPNAVAANGNRVNVANLQAALDQEQKHAAILVNAGARSPVRRFYFPRETFDRLGYTSHAGTFLWVLDHLETACIGYYLAAAERLSALGRDDLAVFAWRHLGVECEHRALYRVIAGDIPSANLAQEVHSFACGDDALEVFRPYLTGRGFPGGATRAITLPRPEQTARVIGRNTSR